MENRTFEEKVMELLEEYNSAMFDKKRIYANQEEIRKEQDRLGKILNDKMIKLMKGE